jgi:hypothetical protein
LVSVFSISIIERVVDGIEVMLAISNAVLRVKSVCASPARLLVFPVYFTVVP